MNEDFVGRGLAFPMRVDHTGRLALVSREQELVESMRIILGTAPGERPMRPEFGCAIHEHVFAAADATTTGRIAHEVEAALLRWEPRVDVLGVKVALDDGDPSLLWIDIEWSPRDDNDPRNLVVPFYTLPPEG